SGASWSSSATQGRLIIQHETPICREAGRSISICQPAVAWPSHDNTAVREVCVGMDRVYGPRPARLRYALTPSPESHVDLSPRRESARGPAIAQNGDIVPANNRLKHASLIDFILASVRRYVLGDGLSEAAQCLLWCTNLMGPLPAFQCG